MDTVTRMALATVDNPRDEKCEEFLNTINQDAKNWKYIEFRCMIQDILGNEIYARRGSEKLGDRTIFYCITIPGENEWVRRTARGADGLDKFELSASEENCDQNRLSISLVNYSFPIPDGKNKSCLIKVYDSDLVDCLRVNDIVQVGGYVEPIEFEDGAELLTNKSSHQADGDSHNANNGIKNNNDYTNTSNTNNNSNGAHNNQSNDNRNKAAEFILENVIDSAFEPAKDFPERLVPRIHIRSLKKLTHINPSMPPLVDQTTTDITRIKMARARLSTILTQLFGGDSLMAEYLILSLISKIHKRKDVTLGQLTMCLSGFKPEMKFLTEKLYDIMSKITTHSHYIDLSLANLNNLRFTPEKDNENNKMIAGTLQLPDGLYLMLNETALSEGHLTTLGTSNVSTLNYIIQWQKHKYNFEFHSVEIDTDLKILVICEGKSILAVPMTVRIEKNDPETIESMREACKSVDDFLTEELLNMFRYYLTYFTGMPAYEVPDDVTAIISSDFVTWRQEDERSNKTVFSADDLSLRMTLARHLTLSHGESALTHDIWKQVCQMETTRLARL